MNGGASFRLSTDSVLENSLFKMYQKFGKRGFWRGRILNPDCFKKGNIQNFKKYLRPEIFVS